MADQPDQSAITVPSGPSTQDYLNAISQAKANGTAIRNFDPSSFPPEIDSRQVVGALLDGLPDAHANAINARLMSGQPIKKIDFSQIPTSQGSAPGQGGIYQDFPIRRAISKYAIRPALEMGGQALGGFMGAAAGTPEAPGIGTAALGFAGATAGGTAGDELANEIDEKMGLYHPEIQPPASTVGRLGKEALGNAAMVGTGKLAGRFVENAAAPFADDINPEVQEASKSLGVPVTAAQQSNNKLLQQLEQLVAKLPGSSDIISKFYNTTKDKMMGIAQSLLGRQMTPEVADSIGSNVAQQVRDKVTDLAQSGITPQLDPAAVGDSVASDISNYTKGEMAKSSQAFQSLKGAVPEGTTVPLTNTAQKAQQLLEQHQALPPSLQNGKLMSVLNDLSGSPAQIEEEYASNPEVMAQLQASGQLPANTAPAKSIPDLMSLRSALGNAAAQEEGAFATNQPGTKFMGSPVAGAYKSLVGAIDQDLGAFGEQAGNDFSKQYAAARAQHATGTELMNNPYFKRILSTDSPEDIVDLAVKPGDTTNLRNLMGMLSPDTRDQLQNSFVNTMMERSTNADGQFVPQKLSQLVKKYGDDTINLAAGDHGQNWLNKMANFNDGTWSDPGFRNFIAQLGRKDGENVTSFMMQPNNGANINRLRILIGEPAFNEAQDGMTYNLLTNNQGNVDFGGLAKRMADIGPETIQAGLGPEKAATLQKLAVLGNATKSPGAAGFANPSGTAPMLGTFWLVRTLFNNPMSAIRTLAGIAGATSAYTKPLVEQWLTEGLPGAGVASKIASAGTRIPVSVMANNLRNPYGRRNQ